MWRMCMGQILDAPIVIAATQIRRQEEGQLARLFV